MAEVAILGAIVLVALSLLVRLGLNLTYRHMMTQESFRKAMATAYNRFAHDARYTVVEDRLMPDAANPYTVGARSRMVSSSAVLWGRRLMGRKKSDVENAPKVIEVNFKADDPLVPPYRATGLGYLREYGDELYSEDEDEKLGLTGSFEKELTMNVDMTRSDSGASSSTTLNVEHTELITTTIRTAGGGKDVVEQTLERTRENAW